jgi:hypothetical protein
MWWRLGWFAGLLILTCGTPQTTSNVPEGRSSAGETAAAPEATAWTPNPNEPWKLTATAEVVAGPTQAVIAQATEDARHGAALAHHRAAQEWRTGGYYGLALEEMGQAQALWPDNQELRTAVVVARQEATRAVPTQRALATRVAIDARTTAQRAEAVAATAAIDAQVAGTQAAVDARRVATQAAYARVCRFADGRAVLEVLSPYVSEMRDELRVANRTARIALGQRIADLQETRRAVQRERWPPCAGQAATYLVRAMDTMIDGYLAFQSGASAASVGPKFREAGQQLEVVSQQVRGIAY